MSKKLCIDFAVKQLNSFLKEYKHKQNPDSVTINKQWDECGFLKGWIISLKWFCENGKDYVEVYLDSTPFYTRIVGNIDKIPDYIPLKHQYPKK